jgi:alanyl-tRNA synthetase
MFILSEILKYVKYLNDQLDKVYTYVKGEFVFKLMDTHGCPLDMMIDVVDSKEDKIEIDWVGFIRQGWEQGWLTFQIYEKIKNSYGESLSYTKREVEVEEILNKIRLYMCVHDENYVECLF